MHQVCFTAINTHSPKDLTTSEHWLVLLRISVRPQIAVDEVPAHTLTALLDPVLMVDEQKDLRPALSFP